MVLTEGFDFVVARPRSDSPPNYFKNASKDMLLAKAGERGNHIRGNFVHFFLHLRSCKCAIALIVKRVQQLSTSVSHVFSFLLEIDK